MDGPGGELSGVGVHQEADAEKDEGNAEELTHIQGHIGLKFHLVVLDEFDEEAGTEAHGEEDAHKRAAIHIVQFFPV